MNKEIRDVIKPLVECVALLSDKNSVIIQLLTAKLDFSTDEKRVLLDSVKENERLSQNLRQSLESLQ